MISGNRIQFGYGSVCVGSDPCLCEMHFRQIRPPQECGSYVMSGNAEYIGDRIAIWFNYNDYSAFSKLLNSVEKREISEFTFKDYIFDFSTYNAESVKVCKKHLAIAIQLHILSLAC